MGERSVKGVMLQHAVDHIQALLDAGTLTREQLELQLERENLALFDKGEIVGGLWYPAARYERLLELIFERAGRQSDALVEFGRGATLRLLKTQAFAGMFQVISRTAAPTARPARARSWVKLSEVLLDFTRWKYLGPRLDDFSVEVSEASDFHQHARFAVRA